MSNVKDVKPRVKTITLNDGVEREVRFTLNAMAELEDRYGSVDAAFDALNGGSIKAARCILWAGMLESNPDLTERQVGSLIDVQCLERIMADVNAIMEADMPGSEENAGNAENVLALPNV